MDPRDGNESCLMWLAIEDLVHGYRTRQAMQAAFVRSQDGGPKLRPKITSMLMMFLKPRMKIEDTRGS